MQHQIYKSTDQNRSRSHEAPAWWPWGGKQPDVEGLGEDLGGPWRGHPARYIVGRWALAWNPGEAQLPMALTSAGGTVAGCHVADCCCCCWRAEARTGCAPGSLMGEKVDMALTSASGTYRWRGCDRTMWLSLFFETWKAKVPQPDRGSRRGSTVSAHLCSGVKWLASWLMGAQGTAKGGLWTGSVCWLGDPALAVIGCCMCSGRGPGVGLATWGWGGGVCSLSGCVPPVLVGPQGETGVEGGVNGLNPGVGFLSQALWKNRFHQNKKHYSQELQTICYPVTAAMLNLDW